MENEILNKLIEQEEKINVIYKSVEKTRKYILYMTIISIAFVVLPIIGLLFVIPSFVSTYSSVLGGF